MTQAGLDAQVRNIETQYGKPIATWIRIVNESGLVKHTEVVAFLKTKHGMTLD